MLSRDNEWNLRAKVQMALCAPAILRGLGVDGAAGAVELYRFEDGWFP